MSTNAGYWARQTPVRIPSNLLPAPFIPLSPVSWSATGSQVEIRHHESFKKTNRLPAVYQALTNTTTESGWVSLASPSLFFTPFVSSAFDPRHSLSLILTYVRAVHKSDRRIQTCCFGIFSRFRARGKSGKLWAWKFRGFKMSQESLCFGVMNNIDWVV